MPDNILKYHFTDKSGNKHTVWKSDYDADPKGFAEAYPDARFEVVNRKTGDRGNVAVKDIAAAKNEGFDLFTVSHKQATKAPRKAMTPRELAQKVGNDYLSRPKEQMGKAPSKAPKNASPFVKSLYETDNAMKGADYPIDYASPKAVQQVYNKNQQVKKNASRTAARQNEWNRQNQPIYDNGTVGVMKTQGQLEKEMGDSVKNMTSKLFGSELDSKVSQGLNDADVNAEKAMGQYTSSANDGALEKALRVFGGQAGTMAGIRSYNEASDPDKVLAGLSKGIQNLASDPRFAQNIKEESKRLGVSEDVYKGFLANQLEQELGNRFNKKAIEKYFPKGSLDYWINRAARSNTVTNAVMNAAGTKSQRMLAEQAMAETGEGNNPFYKPSAFATVSADVAGMVTDPIFRGAAGVGGKVAGKVIGSSDKLGAILANGNVMQRLGLNIGQAVTSGGVTGFVFGSSRNVIQNVSTGEDTSMGGNLKAALHGGLSEAGSFATMGVAGVPLGMIGRSVGLKAITTTPLTKEWFKQGSAKVGLEAAKTWMEGTGMYLGGYVAGKIEGREQPEFNIIDGTIQSLPTAIGFRVQHLLKGLVSGRMKDSDGKDLSWGKSTMLKLNEFLTSDKAKTSRYLISDDERDQILISDAAKEIFQKGDNMVSLARRSKKNKLSYDDPYLESDIAMVKNSYDKIMADPSISWDAKAKFSAMVMGVVPSSRPMGDYRTFTYEKVGGNDAGYKKYINEYSSTGELLSKISYDTAEKRGDILYRMAVNTENSRLWNAYAALINVEKNDYNLQNQFFQENLKNWAYGDGNQEEFIAGMLGYRGSTYMDKYTAYVAGRSKMTREAFRETAEQLGMSEVDFGKIIEKDPLKRTDEEQNACVQLRKNFEKAAYPENKAHAEQSKLEGKDVARENNLGSDTPNPTTVVTELRNLSQAEDDLQAFMDSNDVFKETYEAMKKQGLTNPQIYDAMILQNGLTEEQLEPFARYLNANARVQGMQQATQEAIEQRVESVAGDWAFHGTMDGQQADGSQMLYVKDNNGRTLIVGSGDVAYDPTTGRPKEGVGDMLVCLDVQTREPVYVKVEDTTLDQTQSVEDFKNEERQRLQMINSAPYNQAAQEQAMKDAAKPQPKEEEVSQQQEAVTNDSQTEQNQPSVSGATSEEVNAGSSARNDTNNSSNGNENNTSLTFEDGSPVPMVKDSKGRLTPDYGNMKPEQAAEILTKQFGESAEKVVDGQIKKAEKAVKDANKMKVNYEGELNDILEQQNLKNETVAAANKQLEHAQAIKKAMTAKKVAETVGKTKEEQPTDGANQAGSVAAQKFQGAPRLVGNKRSRTLPNNEKIKGHYEIVPAESLTPSHDATNGYKKSEGFPVDAEGRTTNDRDYENDKAAQQSTDQIALKYNGQAIEQVPVVSDEGIVYDGNGRTMAGQKAAKEGTDGEYISELLDNAENFGFTREQIEKSGIEHPRLVLVTDERMPYTTETFAKFNRNEKKAQNNTEQAVAKSKTLSPKDVGAIVAEIEGNGSLEAFFNNPNAISSLWKTLQEKGIIGQNEVAGLQDMPGVPNAQGKEFVKNLVLGAMFKPETIRMMGVDSAIKNKVINGVRAIMDNSKLGDYALGDEIDGAIRLLYEARTNKSSVGDLLSLSNFADGNARDRFSEISQALAQALEGKISVFRDLISEYNKIAIGNGLTHKDAKEQALGGDFGEVLDKDALIKKFLDISETIKQNNIKLYGEEGRNSEQKDVNVSTGNEERSEEAGGRAGEEAAESQQRVDEAVKKLATEITKQTGVTVHTDEKESQKALEDAEATDSDVKYHKETDKEILDELNSGKTVKVYRAMQVIDGKLYPPMAASVGGKMVEANELGTWIRADENPDLAIPDIDPKTGRQKVDPKTGELKWKFKLDKGGKDATGKKATTINAAYNPYWHMSRSPLNDQFKSAWIRPNIVVVECEVPESELTSGYKAERAKDAVGEVDWKSGSVSGEVFKQTGRARKVILSRWCKPVRVLSDAEVAQRAKEFVGDAKVEIPENVLTPKQRVAFEEAGFKIGAPEKGVKKSDQIAEALKAGLQVDNSVREFRSKNGEVYGFVTNGEIHLDTKKMKPETPLHEYTHLWTSALQRVNAKEWENVKSLLDSVEGLKDEVQKLYPDLKGDDLYDEMLATYSGREGTKKLEETAKSIAAKEGKSLTDSVKAQSFLGKVKEALKKYWNDVADMLHINFTSAEDVADKVLSGWASGVNPNEIKTEEKSESKKRTGWDRLKELAKMTPEQLAAEEEKGRKEYEVEKRAKIQEKFEAEKDAFKNEQNNEYADVLRKSKTPEEAAEKFRKMAAEKRAVAADWRSRKYKKNNTPIDSHDIYGEEKTTTISAANERRRKAAVNNALEAAKDYDDFADTILNRCGLPKDSVPKIEGKSEPITITTENGEEKTFSSEQVDLAKKIISENPDKPITHLQRQMKIGYEAATELAKALGWQDSNEKIKILPKEGDAPANPSNPLQALAKAADDFKKEHPMTEKEIMEVDGLDDEAKYTAIDYLNGEDDSEVARICYEQAYNKRGAKRTTESGENVPQTEKNHTTSEKKDTTSATNPMEAIEKAAAEYNDAKPKTAAEKKAAAKKLKEESDKKTQELMNQFLAAKNDNKNGGGKMLSTIVPIPSKALKWMNRNLTLSDKQKELLPQLLSAIKGSMYARIKEGIYNLEDVIENVRKDFKGFFDALDKDDANKILAEAAYKGRFTDPETGERIKLVDAAEREKKLTPEHQKNLVGDSKTAEERKQKENSFISNLKMIMGSRKVNGIRELRQLAKELGLEGVKDTDLQELAETAVVSRARDIASSKAMSPERKFAEIRKLYENQPSLNQRDSDRVEKQQYSTPAPYAYLADMYVKGNGKEINSALEPSAGNGMLTIGLPMDKVHVNDIDEARLLNLHRQGFKNITSQDGTQPFADKDVDVVVTNPPFGTATPKEYDGYKISSLEGQMAINALESMKDDGRAAIIIGGKTEYAKNGSLNPKDKAFLGYLYSHYNVEDVINVDGSLYAKQGTTYPTRIILINGRRTYDPENKVYPPIQKEARAESVKDYDELYKRINDDILRSRQQSAGVLNEQSGESKRVRTDSDVRKPDEKVLRGTEREGREGDTSSNSGDIRGDKRPIETSVPELGSNENTNREGASPTSGGTSVRDGGRDLSPESNDGGKDDTSGAKRMGDGNRGGRPNASGVSRRGDNVTGISEQSPARGVGLKETPKRELNTEKVKYVSQSSNPFSLNSVIPADQAKVTKKALDNIGDVDEFLVSELGYNDKEDMYHALGSEQADSVALAIHQAKQGNAFIIGDMTGIGKGRQAAAMIRYAYKSGKIPVFITAKKDLFSDMYRDLKSIGNAELRPFIWAAKDKDNSADMLDSEGNLVYKRTPDAEQKKVMAYLKKYGKLPEGYDYIVTTYDSFNGGTMGYENGKKTARKDGKGSKNGQAKRDLLEVIAKNANVIMDESHKAGGNGGGSSYLQYIVPKLNAITFLSATYAKRPENMPIYALRTSMNQAGVEPAVLIDAIKRGGTTLQEIMSQSLAASGQFIRRERDMTGVTIDWKAIEDPVVVQEQREQYDKIIGLFNDIIDFQRTYVNSYIEQCNEDISKTQGSINNKQGTADLGIKNTPFASRTYNMVQQVLLSLKAREAAKSAIEHLKNGEKVVIALNNTNESQTSEYAEGVEMEAPDLGVVLKKGLNGVLRYEQSDDMGNKTYGYFDVEELGPEAAARYREIEDSINNASTGLSLSPIDVIRDELEDAGYKVGELTGRTYQLARNPNGTVSKVKRTNTDKKKLALDFNTDKLDVLILNRSASTGISLHDSKDFNVKEHKPRTMIVVQQQADVNEEVQMRGRIDRTGQVNRGRYEYIVSQIPSEQRLLMMFKSKLRSLDANTTSSQKSKFNDMEVNDIINKYGDKVVKEYMADHLDLYAKMADPFGWEESFGNDLSTIDTQRLIGTSKGKLGGTEAGADASKLLGRMALLKVAEQEKMLAEIGELYKNEINRLNEMGENDLEITELPLKAKTIGKEVWKEGSEPNGDNAFADNTYIEKVSMAILKKPMKGEEVKKAQEGLTGGRSWDEYKEEKKTALKEYFVKKFNDEKERLDERAKKVAQKAADKYNKEAKKNQDMNQLTDEQIEKNTQFQYDNVYKEEKTKADTALKNIKTKYQAFDRVLDTFNTNEAYVLPTDMNNPNEMSAFGNSYGRLIDIKISDNYSPTASTISFATSDGRRKITFPIHGLVGSGDKKVDVISTIYRLTKQAEAMADNNYKVVNKSIDNWDRMISNESRKDGYIITGNLMQALIDTKAQGLGGQLVKYTTDNGEVKTGILMPDRFKPTDAATEKTISSKADDFMSGKTTDIMSSDGEVRLTNISTWRGSTIELRVPKSKAKGGKYYLDEKLRSLADNNDFYTKGGSMVANLQPENVRAVLDRLSALGVKVREERKKGTHFRTEREGTSSGSIVSDHVAKIVDKVGGNVNMVNSPEEVTNPAVKERLDKGENVTGWYDEKTGEVHLYMPNIHDRYTAEKTIWHETVGHKGMRGLFGDKFNDFLRSIYYDLDKPENAALKQLVDEERKYNPLNIYDAIEEGIARLAEDGKGEVGFWNTIKNKVTDLLHEIGYRIAPNTKDVKYLLWLSKNLQKNPNSVYWKLKANAVRYRLENEKLTTVKGGSFADNDGKVKNYDDFTRKDWEEATDMTVHFRTTPSAATEIEIYNRAVGNVKAMAEEAYSDKMNSVLELYKAIDPSIKRAEDVKTSENPYMMENLMSSRAQQVGNAFVRDKMDPLTKAFDNVLGSFSGKDMDDRIRNANLYLVKKSGLERNRAFFVRDNIRKLAKNEDTMDDAKQLQADWNAEHQRLKGELDKKQITLKEYFDGLDDFIRKNVDNKYDPNKNDYSGFHEMQNIQHNQDIDDALIQDEVMSAESSIGSGSKVDELWNTIKAATDYSLHMDYSGGFMDKEMYQRVSDELNWYVPMRMFDQETAEDVYGYIDANGGRSGFVGPALVRAQGRKSLSNLNILAQIGAMGEYAINRSARNAIKQAFMRFVSNNEKAPVGERLVTEINPWFEKVTVGGVDTWEERFPTIPDDATPLEISQAVENFENAMKAKEAKGEAKRGVRRGNINYKFADKNHRPQHIVDVWVNGKKKSYIINGNPRAAQAINGMLDHKGAHNFFSKSNRWLSQVCTSYNPEFTVRNAIRDYGFATHTLLAKEGMGYVLKFEKHYAALGLSPIMNAAKGVGNGSLGNIKNALAVSLFKQYKDGTLDVTKSKYHKWFKEFMDNGGETGYLQMKNVDAWKKQIDTDIKNMHKGKLQKINPVKTVVGFVEDMNQMAENIARFATFCASREIGRNATRSAYDAKEVSVNFNRSGSAENVKNYKYEGMGSNAERARNAFGFSSYYLRNYTMFFNASVQSFKGLCRNVQKTPARTIASMVAAPMSLGLLMPLVNQMLYGLLDDDEKDRKDVKDPYAELPDYIRRSNVCIYAGKGRFIQIPIAIEGRAFYGLGDIAASYTYKKDLKENRSLTLDIANQLAQIIPVGSFMESSSTSGDYKAFLSSAATTVLPSLVSPVVELVSNRDWKGQPIYNDATYMENAPAWKKAYSGTSEVFTWANKKANAWTNDVDPGNENMKGSTAADIATNPFVWEQLFDSYVGGMGTFSTRTFTTIGHALDKDKEVETKDIPFVRNMLYTPSSQTSLQRTKSKWYNYKDEVEVTNYNLSQLKRDSKDPLIGLKSANAWFKYINSPKAEEVNIVNDYDGRIGKLNKTLKVVTDDNTRRILEDEKDKLMQEAVAKLDSLDD